MTSSCTPTPATAAPRPSTGHRTSRALRLWNRGAFPRSGVRLELSPAPPLTLPLPSLRGERASAADVVVAATELWPSPRNGERWPRRAAAGSVRGLAAERRARAAPLRRRIREIV